MPATSPNGIIKKEGFMHNFFIKEPSCNGIYTIYGADYNHVKNVLRMQVGDTLLVSDGKCNNLCEIVSYENDSVVVKIIEENYCDSSLPIEIYLFQGLPKSDKMELIIQKAVELGVTGIIPVEMSRCVVKLDKNKKNIKTARWQAISESAAKQCKRAFIPQVLDVLTFSEALKMSSEFDLLIVPYEDKNGMNSTKDALLKIKSGMKVGIMIGPEGGFSPEEIEMINNMGGLTVSLGKRILRTETAAIASLSMLMLYAEMNLK